MKVAKEAGVDYILNGLGMMLEQGAEAFKLWTGEDMPVDYIRELLFSEDNQAVNLMRIVKVRNVEFGTGRPKIAVPITGKSSDDIIKQAETIMSSNNADLIEWRIDFFDQVEDAEKLVETAKKLRQVMSEMPLLTTFRTHFEGGVKKLSEEEYFDICRVLIKEKATDLLDLELFRKTSKLKEIIAEAHENNIYIIMSNHDFDKTPATSELERRLTLLKIFGADIAKITVMPNSAHDVLNLLLATDNMKYK